MNFLHDLCFSRPGNTRLLTAENPRGLKGKGGMATPPVCDEAGNILEPGQPGPGAAELGQPNSTTAYSRDLGQTWKVRPCLRPAPKTTVTLMDHDGPGVIQHLWFTASQKMFRDLILRLYWDGQDEPSVETPLGDFFCNGWNKAVPITALPVNVNPTGGLNCYFPMPFRKHARLTIENRHPLETPHLFYAITYAEQPVPDNALYFHAQFRRSNPLPYAQDYTIVDGLRGRGHYVGTYMAWQQNNWGWWGEGEVKFFVDGDGAFPTLCGTGTEDYFGGAWGFDGTFSAPFLGYPLGVPHGAGAHPQGTRHGIYRFHLPDPILFQQDLRVTMQALGWRSEGRLLPLQDDIASVAYWYQTLPHAPFPMLGSRELLEVI